MSDEENLNTNVEEPEKATEIPNTEEKEEKEGSGEQSGAKEETTESSDNEEDVSKTYTQDQVEALMAKTKDIALRRARREAEENRTTQDNNVSSGQIVQSQVNPDVQPSPNHKWDNVLGWIPNDTSVEQYSNMVENAVSGSQQSQNTNSGQEQSQQASRQKVSEAFWDQLDKCCINHDDADVVLNSIPTDIADYAARITKKDGLGIESIYRLQKENPQRMFEISRISDAAERQHAVTMLIHETAQRRKKKTKSNATPQPAPITGAGGAAGTKTISDMSYEEEKALRIKEGRL